MNKAEFIEAYGHRYARCNIPQQHNAHAWESPAWPTDVAPERPDEYWWCSGEAVRPEVCPTCESADPAKHPSTQPDGGEVNLCRDAWHDVDPRTHELREKLEVGEAVTNKLVRWADRAMFKAEPMPDGGPRVYLLWMTPDPLGAIAAACKMYKGEVVRDLSRVTDAERLEYLEQVQKTKLKAPFEFVKFHFLIEGVTRSFTHQMVRQRTACLTGDTRVYTKRKSRRYTLAELYARWITPGGKTWIKNMMIRTSDDEGQIVYRHIGNISKRGVKSVYQLTTHDGRVIKATSDHRFWLPTGEYAELEDLKIGDLVVSNGKKWTPEQRAHFSKWCRENRPGRNPDGYTGVDPGHRVAQQKYGHRLAEGCSWCGSVAGQLAHIDGNPENNSPENIQPMCIDCHICMDRNVFPEKTYAAEITSIEYVGEEMTYDIGMEGEFSRFVANGLVVHNCYAQESLRFAVKGDDDSQIPVGLPPSLAGTDDWDAAMFRTESMTTGQKMRQAWEDTVNYVDEQYAHLIDLGMPAEDARGLLPHNTLTRLHYSTDLRALLDHAGNRLCTQAQFEWRLVFAKLVEAIRDAATEKNHTGYERGGSAVPDGISYVYMADKLAEMFKPVCYQTGKCEFKANFDRACSIRSRVDANEAAGRPSSEWAKDSCEDTCGEACNGGCKNLPLIDAIKPGEWLLDPGAAREKK